MDLVAPIVPNAQENKGPELFLSALGQGLQAFSRFAQMKRDSEMQIAKLAEHERVSQEENVLAREKMALDAEYRETALSSTMDLNRAHADYYRAGAKAYTEGTKTATQRAIAFNQQRQDLVNDVNQQASALRLDDPNFATKEPVAFAANVMKFEDMFSLSPLPEVKHALKRYRTVADQQKMTLKEVDASGNPIGEGRARPVWQVVKNLQDPETKEQTLALLKANGYMTDVIKKTPGTATKSWKRPLDTAWDAIVGPTEKKEVVDEPTPELQKIIEKGKGVNFEREQSRVAPAMLPKDAAGGTTPTDLPAPDLPPEETPTYEEPQAQVEPKFDETQTDKLIRQAKAAIAKGAPRDAVAARLQEMSIDPSVLFEAAA